MGGGGQKSVVLASCQNENHVEIVWQVAKEKSTLENFGKLPELHFFIII